MCGRNSPLYHQTRGCAISMKKEGELAMFELRIVTDAWPDEDGCMVENNGYWYGDILSHDLFSVENEYDALQIACGIPALVGVDRAIDRGGEIFDLYAGNEWLGYFIEVPMMNAEMAREALERYKDKTGYFDGSVGGAELKEILLNHRFGEAESNVIVASLVLAGALLRV